jgi:hypothetical protein
VDSAVNLSSAEPINLSEVSFYGYGLRKKQSWLHHCLLQSWLRGPSARRENVANGKPPYFSDPSYQAHRPDRELPCQS